MKLLQPSNHLDPSTGCGRVELRNDGGAEMGTLQHGDMAERIDDVDLLHLERVIAQAFDSGIAFTLVIDDESPAEPVRMVLDPQTPIELRYASAVGDERIDDARMHVMLATLVDSGVLHAPRAR